MMLCDVCGYPCRSNHGFDKCENSPARINMLMMSKLPINNIDVRKGWRDYVQAVHEDDKHATLYPDLTFNRATWEQDLRDQIIVCRRRHWDGTEAREREVAEVSRFIPSLGCNKLTLL